jgi:hypothetical protein
MRLLRSPILPCVLALAAGGFVACGGDDGTAPKTAACPVLASDCPAELPSYANEVAPLFAAHCGQCHSSDNPLGPWPLDNASDIADWSLSIKADLEDCLMPPPDSDAPLSDADRQTLHVWLACGAPNN